MRCWFSPGVRFSALLFAFLLIASTLAGCGGDSSSPSASSSPTLTSLTIGGSPVAQVGGSGYQFIALAQYSNLTSSDVTTSATWTSSNTQIASLTFISGRPLLSALQRGTVSVSASYGGKTATLNVTVS